MGANASGAPALPQMPDSTPPGKPHFDSTGVQVGEQLPDLSLYTLDGKKEYGALRGPALILTSSYSCPKSRSAYPAAAKLAEKFKGAIPTIFIYVIEAHPKGDPSPYSGVEDVTVENERDQVFCTQPRTLQERLALAKKFKKRLEVSQPIYVDGMDNAVWKSLGGGPNMGFLIDEKGIVLARQGWFDAKSMETAATAFRAATPKRERRSKRERFAWDAVRPAEDGDLEKVKSQLTTSPELATKIFPYQERGGQGDRTLLHYAVQGNHLPVVEFLVSKGADINLQTEHAPTPLHLAAETGDLPIAKFLIDHGAKVNLKAQGHGPTPLQEALINGHPAVAQLLIKSGAASNFFTDVANGNLEAVQKQLVADPTIAVRPDGWDRPPLAYATAAAQEKVVAALLAAGAHDLPPDTYKYEGSAIWWAVDRKNVAMVRLLCQSGSDPNLLGRAIHGGSVPVIRELLAQKADPNRADIQGYRPLHNAVLHDQPEVIRLLIDAGADPNAPTGPNRAPCGPPGPDPLFAPLHLAAKQGSVKAIAELLKHRAEINGLDHAAKTPLHYAAESYVPPANLVVAVKELLSAGADVNAKDAEGLTPLDLALKGSRTADKPDASLVDLLRAHGAKPGSEVAGSPGVPPAQPKNSVEDLRSR
jgi:ankyrin repeat protein